MSERATGDRSASRERAFERAPCALIVVDDRDRVVEANARARRLLEVELQAPVGLAELVAVEHGVHAWLEDVRRGDQGPASARLGERELPFDLAGCVLEDGQVEIALIESTRERAHAETMEALERLAGHLAHDVNNMLGAILGYASLLKMELGDGAVSEETVEELLAASRRPKELLQRVLTFSRRSLSNPKPIELGELARSVVARAREAAGPSIHIALASPTPLVVNADPEQLRLVLGALVENATEALATSGGRIDLRVEADDVTGSGLARHDGLAVGPHACVTVTDDGPGIPEADRLRVLEPFVTTKAGVRRAGLGLSIAHGIVRGHGGRLVVEPGPDGRGTSVHVYLPVAGQAGAATLAPSRAGATASSPRQ